MSALPVVGVLIAAGRGRRLGGGKQLLPWPPPDGDRTLVACAFDAIAPACDTMLVVVGHAAEDVARALAPRVFTRIAADPDVPMFESIRAGLRAVQGDWPGHDVILQPGDHPDVARATLDTLLTQRGTHPGCALIPQHEGRGGHPVLIPHAIVPRLVAGRGDGGLRAVWAQEPTLSVRIDVDDPSVVRDVDTPADAG